MRVLNASDVGAGIHQCQGCAAAASGARAPRSAARDAREGTEFDHHMPTFHLGESRVELRPTKDRRTKGRWAASVREAVEGVGLDDF